MVGKVEEWFGRRERKEEEGGRVAEVKDQGVMDGSNRLMSIEG